MSAPEAIKLAARLDSVFISEDIGSGEARRIAAELRRLSALNAELLSELTAMHRNCRHHVDTISNWAIAMQAAVIAARNVDHEEGMMWIDNTLEGPGLLPPADFAGSAQEWFDAKTAEHEAWCAAHPVKYQGTLIAKAEGGAA